MSPSALYFRCHASDLSAQLTHATHSIRFCQGTDYHLLPCQRPFSPNSEQLQLRNHTHTRNKMTCSYSSDLVGRVSGFATILHTYMKLRTHMGDDGQPSTGNAKLVVVFLTSARRKHMMTTPAMQLCALRLSTLCRSGTAWLILVLMLFINIYIWILIVRGKG